MKLTRRTKMLTGILVAATVLLVIAPNLFASASSGRSSRIVVTGTWQLTSFNSTTFYTQNGIQYGAGWGIGPFLGGIQGANSQGEYLTAYNLATGVITFTGQIHCVCTIAGRTGDFWISMTNGIDQNASDPNGKTTAEFAIVGASGGLAGVTGSGPMVTTTSSNDMNFTMVIHLH